VVRGQSLTATYCTISYLRNEFDEQLWPGWSAGAIRQEIGESPRIFAPSGRRWRQEAMTGRMQ
jgi:hypothetical protein